MQNPIRLLVVGLVVMSLCGGCGGGDGGEGGPQPDTTPPEILSGPSLSSLSIDGVTITWETDEMANGTVEYGATASYGSLKSDAAYRTEHEIVLEGLSHRCGYHFRVCSSDESGNGPTCSSDETFTTLTDHTLAGWEAFEAGDLETAEGHFDSAVSENRLSADAHLGKGWCNLLMKDTDSAVAQLDSALELDHARREDAHCGLCLTHLAREGFPDASAHADSALNRDASYEFPHMNTIDFLDVHLVRAEAYFYQGESHYSKVQTSVDVIDPNNNLDPEDDSTWIVGGRSYGSYAEALLAEIERTRGLVAD